MNINKIINLYKSKRITQQELAEAIGMSKTNINQILIGKTEPKISTIEKIAEYFNVPVAYFFDDNSSTGGNNSVQIGKNNVAGNISGSNNKISVSADQCRHEVEMLRELLKAKEHIIELLNEQIKSMRKK